MQCSASAEPASIGNGGPRYRHYEGRSYPQRFFPGPAWPDDSVSAPGTLPWHIAEKRGDMTQTKRSKPDNGKGGLPATADPLGPTVLLAGEDQAAYDRLAADITASVKPQDTIESIWVRDVVELVFESRRLRRLKAAFCALASGRGLRRFSRPWWGMAGRGLGA